jgi:hypothetical protein
MITSIESLNIPGMPTFIQQNFSVILSFLNKRGDVKLKRISFPISLTIICFLIQSCAVHGSLSKNELEAMQSIEVVRHTTPDLEAKTSTGVVIKHAMSGPLAGILGHTYNKATFRKMTEGKVLPDYGELMTRKFADRVKGEVPGWPETTLKEMPVHGHFDHQGHNLIEFKVTEIGVSSLRGFIMKANVSIRKSTGDKVYSRHISYQGASLGRKHTLDDYFANDCKILMEEFSFSTDYIVTELIKSLNNQPADLYQK